jgi:ABC-2 type transport system permease protein
MSAATFNTTVGDSATMIRRSYLRMRRYPTLTFALVLTPLVVLVLFVYVFGGAMGQGLGSLSGGRKAYLDYILPGILLMGVASSAQTTAISVAKDMTEGIIARFRTMDIARGSVLTGHVVGAWTQCMLALVVVALGAVGLGFRAHGGAGGWLGAAGILALITFAVTWLAVGMGLAAKSVESSSNTPMILLLLLFFGSSFVPTATMPVGLRWFAQHQPFTPFNESVRGLLTGHVHGGDVIATLAWCAGITVVSYIWSLRRYNRDPDRAVA